MRIRRWVSVLVVCLMTATAARATTLVQLRARLKAMQVAAPLVAQVSVDDRTVDGGGAAKVTQETLALRIDDGANGLDVHLPSGVLARAERDRAMDNALDLLDPVMLQGLADFAPALLRKLDGATLTGQHDATRAGAPVHVMVFDIPGTLDKASRDAISHHEGRLTVWLGSDGLPVAVRESQRYSGRKFFISFSFSGDQDYSVQRIGQRLVVRRYHGVHGGKGMGRHLRRTVDITLTPQRVAAPTRSG